ncbi:hypothetical protein ACWD3P_45785 [Streptomyces sp. NPDC002765]
MSTCGRHGGRQHLPPIRRQGRTPAGHPARLHRKPPGRDHRAHVRGARLLHDPAAAIAEAVGAITDAFRAHETLLRVFLLLGTRHEAVRAEGSRVSVEGNRHFTEALRHTPVAHADPEAALDFAYRLTYAAIAHRSTQGEFLESERPLPWTELRTHLQTAVISYLLGTPEGH